MKNKNKTHYNPPDLILMLGFLSSLVFSHVMVITILWWGMLEWHSHPKPEVSKPTIFLVVWGCLQVVNPPIGSKKFMNHWRHRNVIMPLCNPKQQITWSEIKKVFSQILLQCSHISVDLNIKKFIPAY